MEVIWAAIGWALGILLNTIVSELPRSHQLSMQPRCPRCETLLPLGAFTVLPLGTRGGCPRCGTVLTWPLSSLEWPTALVFGTLAWRFGMSLPLLIYSLYALALLVVLAIDLRHRWVYTIICYPAIVLGVVLSALVEESPWLGLLGALLAGGAFFVLYWVGRLLYHGSEPMGTGDVTIAAMIGAMAGPRRALIALVLGGLIVAGVSLVLLAARRVGSRDFIPYGAGLCLGAILVLCWPDGP
jgi:prepilin signal peptidase PulO-like enzyme (type II secretory pathway)